MGMTFPHPRSTLNSQTTGPCGAQNNDFTGFPVTKLTPGQTLNVVLNAITHPGCNYRLALSQNGSDTYDCILIDHIPQYSTSVSYLIIPIKVPDVNCEHCALQAIMVSPASSTCCDFAGGACGQTWYACANVQISGKTARSELTCTEPCTWAYRDEKPSFYSSSQNDAVWISMGSSNYTLNVTGGYYAPTCQTVTKSVCPSTTTTSAASGSGDTRTNESLASGGKMSAGGVIGIIVVVLVLVGIGLTWFLAIRNKDRTKSKPMISDTVTQAVV